MAIKGMNMIVRVGANVSGLINGFTKAAGSARSFAKQSADALRQTALSEENLRKAMAQGGRNDYIVTLTNQIRELELEQKALKKAGFGFGFEGFDQNHVLLRSLKTELNDYIKSIREAEKETDETAESIDNLGRSSQKSKSDLRGAQEELDGVHRNSTKAKTGVESLVKSIRRVGVVSFGIRLVRSMFGRLSSIVRQYISENSALQSQVNALKASLGQSLAPVINLITNALSRMMPYIVGVSNAISNLISTLAGPGWVTVAAGANSAAAAMNGAGGAAADLKRQLHGFDEITKINEANSGGSGGGSIAESFSAIEGKLPEWVNSWAELLRESVTTGDWTSVGATLAEAVSNALAEVNLIDFLSFNNLNSWQEQLSTFFAGWFSGIDLSAIGEGFKTTIQSLFENFDLRPLFEQSLQNLPLFNPIIGAALEGLFSNLDGYFQPYIEMYTEQFYTFGADIILGVLAGAADAVYSVGKWLKTYIFDPIVEGLKNVFDIHSPSKHPEIRGIGKNIILGVFEGILEIARSPLEWLRTNVFTPISQAMQSLFDGTVMAQFTVSPKNNSYKWMSDVKTWWAQKLSPVAAFTTSVKNDAVSWWNNVVAWWADKVGEVKSFSTGVVNDSETWWSNVKTWWDGNKGTLLMDAFVRDGASDWWSNVKTWWNGNKGTLLMDAFVRDDSDTWWENVKTWWTKAVGKLKLEIELPKIEVEWATTTFFGKPFNYPTGFDVSWGAHGMLLDGAQIFGMAGNTLLGGGEAGREALLPLDRNTGWMDDVADRIAARIGSAGGSEQHITVNVPLDGKVLASTVVRVVNGQARATGHNPLSAWI